MSAPQTGDPQGRPPVADEPYAGTATEPPVAVPQVADDPRPPVLGSNRPLGAGVALVGSVLFAMLLASGGVVLIGLARPGDGTRAWAEAFLASPVLAVPTLLFLVSFLALVAIAHRAGWWAHILGGLVIAGVVYVGSIGILLLLQGALLMSPQGAAASAVQLAVNPAIVLAALLARELVLWLGLGISRSGARQLRRHRAATAAFEERRRSGAAEAARAATRGSVDGSAERTASFDGAPHGG